MKSFPFPRWLCPYIIFFRNEFFRIPDYGLVKRIRLCTTTRQEDTYRISGHPFEGQAHYDS